MQLRQFVGLLPHLDVEVREFREYVRANQKVRAAVRKEKVWWDLYDRE